MSWTVDVDAVTTSFLTGRLRRVVGRDTAPPHLELWIDGVVERSEALAADDPEPLEFRLALPGFCFDAQEHTVEIRCAGQARTQTFQSRYEGFIDPFSHNLLSGWAVDYSRPGVSIEIEIDVNGAQVARLQANLFREDFQECRGFRCHLPHTPAMSRSFVLRARIAGTDIDLQRSPVLSISRPRLVKAVQQCNSAFHYLEQRLLWNRGDSGPETKLSAEERQTFCDLLFEDSSVADLLELRRRFLRPMQPQLTEQYARRDYTTLGSDYLQSLPRHAREAHRDRPVDIIIPIYAGVRETERCLDSVFRSPAGCRYRVICILDNPGASGIVEMVKKFAAVHPQMTLIENEQSVGFAVCVNRAMSLHRDRDVLILQSDCEVHGDWLLRLQRAAYEGIGAGLVNPLTNYAEFLSYPALGAELPEDAPFERLDTFARRVNAGLTVPLPGAIGFCLYVRRSCLDDLGFFHNDQPSGGYYAEKYFSINASAQGWRTLLAADVFVKHRGFVSFAERDADAIEEARGAFERWCPFYADSVTDFLVDDPSLPARRALDVARLEAFAGQVFCFITHGGGGGTERHLQDLSDALALDGIRTLVLYALPGRRVSLSTASLEGIENLRYRVDDEFDRLLLDLRRLRVSHIHTHSNVEIPPELFTIAALLGVPYDITIHDYAWFCPRVNLVNRSGLYCGEPPVSVCSTCTDSDVTRLRDSSRAILAGARRVFCPSEDTRARIERQFALTNLVVKPHPEWIGEPEWRPVDLGPEETVRVACIGRLSGHKGLRVLRQCAAYALEWGLPLHFVVIGSTSGNAQFAGLTNVEITGAYQEQEVDSLIEKYGIRVAFLSSVWPETYSYTLSVALRCGLVPVAFDFGAMAERMKRAEAGILLPPGASVAQIVAALRQAGHAPARPKAARGTGYLNMLRDYYGLDKKQ